MPWPWGSKEIIIASDIPQFDKRISLGDLIVVVNANDVVGGSGDRDVL